MPDTATPTPAVKLLDLMSAFGADSKLVNEGRWVGFPNDESEHKFLIARLNNRGQRAMASRLMLENREIFKNSDKDKAHELKAEEALRQLEAKVMGTQILKGWTSNLCIAGKALGEYTPEKAIDLLTKFEDFRSWVEAAAQDNDEYIIKPEVEEELTKN